MFYIYKRKCLWIGDMKLHVVPSPSASADELKKQPVYFQDIYIVGLSYTKVWELTVILLQVCLYWSCIGNIFNQMV